MVCGYGVFVCRLVNRVSVFVWSSLICLLVVGYLVGSGFCWKIWKKVIFGVVVWFFGWLFVVMLIVVFCGVCVCVWRLCWFWWIGFLMNNGDFWCGFCV